MKGEYSRDGRAPVPMDETTSKVMSSNRGKNTSPEIVLRKALRENGMSGYRIHWNVPGKPDIAYPGRKLAIFVNGCFWHRCPFCSLPLPKTNTEFWKMKFQRNVARDIEKTAVLEGLGWSVMIIWECEIKKDLTNVVHRICYVHQRDR